LPQEMCASVAGPGAVMPGFWGLSRDFHLQSLLTITATLDASPSPTTNGFATMSWPGFLNSHAIAAFVVSATGGQFVPIHSIDDPSPLAII